mmetsp:Transcript_15210/g.47285  ORF Transcript_15210/g.47285 Transcript_15210/m.47285 type:complete len:239 (+) Transcript_15210:535-1251(+)
MLGGESRGQARLLFLQVLHHPGGAVHPVQRARWWKEPRGDGLGIALRPLEAAADAVHPEDLGLALAVRRAAQRVHPEDGGLRRPGVGAVAVLAGQGQRHQVPTHGLPVQGNRGRPLPDAHPHPRSPRGSFQAVLPALPHRRVQGQRRHFRRRPEAEARPGVDRHAGAAIGTLPWARLEGEAGSADGPAEGQVPGSCSSEQLLTLRCLFLCLLGVPLAEARGCASWQSRQGARWWRRCC